MLQSTLLRAPTSTRARRYLSELLGRAQMSLRLIFVSPAARSKLFDPSGRLLCSPVVSLALALLSSGLATSSASHMKSVLQSTLFACLLNGATEHIV